MSEFLGQVLDKLLQNATKRRYQSAEAVLRDLNSNETVSTDIERLSDTASAQPTDSSPPVTPIVSVTVFDPKTQSWHRIPNLSERPESAWAVAPFLHPQVASPSPTCITTQVASTGVARKRRESSEWVLIALWVAIFACFAIGLRLKQPATSLEVGHSILRFLEDLQPIRPSLNLSSTN